MYDDHGFYQIVLESRCSFTVGIFFIRFIRISTDLGMELRPSSQSWRVLRLTPTAFARSFWVRCSSFFLISFRRLALNFCNSFVFIMEMVRLPFGDILVTLYVSFFCIFYFLDKGV